MSGEASLAPMVDGACCVMEKEKNCGALFCFPPSPPQHFSHTHLPSTHGAGTISVITNDGRHVVVSHGSDARMRVREWQRWGACGATDAAITVLLTPSPTQHAPPQGVLRGFDQATNLIVDDCHERVYSSKVSVDARACARCRRLPPRASRRGPCTHPAHLPPPPKNPKNNTRPALSRCPWPASRSSEATTCELVGGTVRPWRGAGRHATPLPCVIPHHAAPSSSSLPSPAHTHTHTHPHKQRRRGRAGRGGRLGRRPGQRTGAAAAASDALRTRVAGRERRGNL